MKTLTPTQYQSLPVNEQSNWKEQWQYLTNVFKNGLRFETGKTEEWLNYDGEEELLNETRLIYIPITQTLKEVAYDFCQKYKDIGYAASQTIFIAGHSQGKKDHNKEVIDIVEAEIKDCDYCASQCSDEIAVKICNAEKSALKVVLRKLKEIK